MIINFNVLLELLVYFHLHLFVLNITNYITLLLLNKDHSLKPNGISKTWIKSFLKTCKWENINALVFRWLFHRNKIIVSIVKYYQIRGSLRRGGGWNWWIGQIGLVELFTELKITKDMKKEESKSTDRVLSANECWLNYFYFRC